MPPAIRKRVTSRKVAPQASPVMEPAPYQQSPLVGLLFFIVIILLGFSIYLFQQIGDLKKQAENSVAGGTAGQPQARPQRPTSLKIKKPSISEHWRGVKNARFVWVEYSDLECPFCKRIHPDMVKLMDENKDKVAWVYRHYPLSFHQNAQKEGEGAECATELGGNDAFWSYVDKIYERTTSNGTGFALDALGPLAAELGVDQSKFQDCLDQGKYTKKVKDEFSEGSNAGIQATPTGVIYDIKTGKTVLVEGALPFASLKQALDQFIAQAK